MPERDWALLPVENAKAEINISNHFATTRNGKIRAEITASGDITFYKKIKLY